MEFEFPEEEYSFVSEICDEDTCNPLKVWHDMGEPSSLNDAQKDILKRAAVPLIRTDRSNGKVSFDVKGNGVIYFSLKPNKITPDRGYDYERVIGRK